MAADHVELVIVEWPRLLQDRVWDGELADVVHEPADRELPETAARKAEALADLHCEMGDPAGVLLGVLVLPGEPERDPADVRAEEDLLGDHEILRLEVAGEGPRLDGVREVDRNRDADDQDSVQLEHVAEPPTELGRGQGQRRDERPFRARSARPGRRDPGCGA